MNPQNQPRVTIEDVVCNLIETLGSLRKEFNMRAMRIDQLAKENEELKKELKDLETIQKESKAN